MLTFVCLAGETVARCLKSQQDCSQVIQILADLTPLLPSFNPLIGWGLIPILGLSPWLLAVLVPLVGLFVVVPLVFVVGIWLAPVRFVYAFFWLFFPKGVALTTSVY